MRKLLAVVTTLVVLSTSLIDNAFAAPTQFKSRNLQVSPSNYTYSDMEIRSDGLPTIVYVDRTIVPSKFIIVTCHEVSCQNHTSNIVNVDINAFNNISMELKNDIPLIARTVFDSVRYTKCADITCSSSTDITVVSHPTHTMDDRNIDIKLDSNGNPVFAYTYYNDTIGRLLMRTAQCSSDLCNSVSFNEFESSLSPDLELNQNGHRVLLGKSGNTNLQITVCNDTACNMTTTNVLAGGLNSVSNYELGILPNNIPVVLYNNEINELKAILCNNPLCSTFSTTVLNANIAFADFTVNGNAIEISMKEIDGITQYGRLRYKKCLVSGSNVCATTITNTIADDGRGDGRAYENVGIPSDIEVVGNSVFISHYNRTRSVNRFTYTY